MLKIDKYIYTFHRNIVSSNNNKVVRAHRVEYTLVSDNITLEKNKYTVCLLH